MLFVLVDGIAAIAFGVWLVNHPEHPTFGIPKAMYFIFGSIAVLFAVSDGRMLMRGGLFGAQRIGRHLWRMCLALLIAAMSLLSRAGEALLEGGACDEPAFHPARFVDRRDDSLALSHLASQARTARESRRSHA